MSRNLRSDAIRAEIRRLLTAERLISAEILACLTRGDSVTDLRAARRETRDAIEDAYGILHELESTTHTAS
jgi:hypothetical protein